MVSIIDLVLRLDFLTKLNFSEKMLKVYYENGNGIHLANGYGHGAYGSSYDFHATRKGRGHRSGGGMTVNSGKPISS